MKRTVPVLYVVVLAAAVVFTNGCGGKKAGEPAAGEEIGSPSGTRPEGAAPSAAEPAAEEPSGPLGDWPEGFIDELKAAEGIRMIDRLPDNVIQALIKTPKDFKAKGLEAEAEQEIIPNQVAMITLMNGWLTPDRWKEARKMATTGLQALALLRDQGGTDRAAAIQEAVRILKPADISEADLRRVYENEAALAKAVQIHK